MRQNLLLWAALLLVGFACHSCDEVDNAIKNPDFVWNYKLDVRFANFDFGGLTDANGNAYRYQQPQNIYVFNESHQLLGTLKKTYSRSYSSTYSGTLQGAISDRLTISTVPDFNYYEKQDGTIESIIANGILQTATVTVMSTNGYSGELTTNDATLQNKTGIVKCALTGGLVGAGTKTISVTSDGLIVSLTDEQAGTPVKLTLAENVDPTAGFYLALAKESDAAADIYIRTDASSGGAETVACISNVALKKGKIADVGSVAATPVYIDLTAFAAAQAAAGAPTPYQVDVEGNTVISQTGSNPVNNVQLNVHGNTTLTLEGTSAFRGVDAVDGVLIIDGNAVIDGEGELNIDLRGQNGKGIVIKDGGSLTVKSGNVINLTSTPNNNKNNDAGLYIDSSEPVTIEEGASLVINGKYKYGVFVTSTAATPTSSHLTGKGVLTVTNTATWSAGNVPYGIYLDNGSTFTVDETFTTFSITSNEGEGAYIKSGCKLVINGSTATIKGGSGSTAGSANPGIELGSGTPDGMLSIGTGIKSLTVISGQTSSPFYIQSKSGGAFVETPLGSLVSDVTKFKETINSSSRIIKPY